MVRSYNVDIIENGFLINWYENPTAPNGGPVPYDDSNHHRVFCNTKEEVTEFLISKL